MVKGLNNSNGDTTENHFIKFHCFAFIDIGSPAIIRFSYSDANNGTVKNKRKIKYVEIPDSRIHLRNSGQCNFKKEKNIGLDIQVRATEFQKKFSPGACPQPAPVVVMRITTAPCDQLPQLVPISISLFNCKQVMEYRLVCRPPNTGGHTVALIVFKQTVMIHRRRDMINEKLRFLIA